MKKLLIITSTCIMLFYSCFHKDDLQNETKNKLNEEETAVIESHQAEIIAEELIQVLVQIDEGSTDVVDLDKYRGLHLPISSIQHWTQEKALSNKGYGSGGSLIPYSTGDHGALDKIYLPNHIIIFYSIYKDSILILSDWLIIERQYQNTLIEKLVIINNLTNPMDSNLGKQDEFQFGVVHFDVEEHPLVYDKWFHPDAIIIIDTDSGTLELSKDVSNNKYVMIEGV